ncbi:SRPBCC family protein [Actinophytocola sediminis]
MRSIQLSAAVPGVAPVEAFDRLTDITVFSRYSGEIRSIVESQPHAPGVPRHTDWQVEFRRGLLTWTQWDDRDHGVREVRFGQVDGDFADFGGAWRVQPAGVGSRVLFEVTYDFGIESLASAMDPIAERLLLRVAGDIMRGIFGPATEIEVDPAHHNTIAEVG